MAFQRSGSNMRGSRADAKTSVNIFSMKTPTIRKNGSNIRRGRSDARTSTPFSMTTVNAMEKSMAAKFVNSGSTVRKSISNQNRTRKIF